MNTSHNKRSQLVVNRGNFPNTDAYSAFFAALILAHLAFWAAAIFALPAALIFRVGFFGAVFPFNFAQRAFWTAAIFALPAALIVRFFGAAAVVAAPGAAPASALSISTNLPAIRARY